MLKRTRAKSDDTAVSSERSAGGQLRIRITDEISAWSTARLPRLRVVSGWIRVGGAGYARGIAGAVAVKTRARRGSSARRRECLCVFSRALTRRSGGKTCEENVGDGPRDVAVAHLDGVDLPRRERPVAELEEEALELGGLGADGVVHEPEAHELRIDGPLRSLIRGMVHRVHRLEREGVHGLRVQAVQARARGNALGGGGRHGVRRRKGE